MTNRFFIELSYDGTPFHGWQIQKNAKTIQQTLNEALSTVTRQEIYTIGCGRTDTGEEAIENLSELTFKGNSLLPAEIAIDRIFKVNSELHSRFSATYRTYHYFISTNKSPFEVNRAYEFRTKLDLDQMNHGAKILFHQDDFTSFSKLHSDAETNLCTIMKAHWEETANGMKFEIKANRFLRNMVRAIVGTMIQLGEGKISPGDFQKIIEKKDRSAAGYSVPAHGLYLVDIGYPEGSFNHE
jgi:tRNA pseudouridine38-40 synthase